MIKIVFLVIKIYGMNHWDKLKKGGDDSKTINRKRVL